MDAAATPAVVRYESPRRRDRTREILALPRPRSLAKSGADVRRRRRVRKTLVQLVARGRFHRFIFSPAERAVLLGNLAGSKSSRMIADTEPLVHELALSEREANVKSRDQFRTNS